MSFDFDKQIADEVDKRLNTFYAEGIGKEKTDLINGLLYDLKKVYTDVEESTILAALYDEYILIGASFGDKRALEDVKRRILLYKDTHKKEASDKKEKEVISSLKQEVSGKPKTFTNRLHNITDSIKSVFRGNKQLVKDIYQDDSADDRKIHRQVLAAYFYDVLEKGSSYYSANKAVFERDTAYVVNHFFIDNKIFRNKFGGRITGREAVNIFYKLIEEYDVAHKSTVNNLKRQLASVAFDKYTDKQEAFRQYTSGEKLRKEYFSTAKIAVNINKAVLNNWLYKKEKAQELKKIEQVKAKTPAPFVHVKRKYKPIGDALQHIKESPWYRDNEGLVYDAFGLHKLISNITVLKQVGEDYAKDKEKSPQDSIRFEVLMDESGKRFVRQYIRDERGVVVSTVDYAKEKKKNPVYRIRKAVYDKFFKVDEKPEKIDDRYYSKQHKGAFFRNEEDHLYYYEDEKGNIETIPGITATIAHFLGGAYDEPYSSTNLVGIKKGKEEFHSAEAQVNGTAIHSLVNKYYRTGMMLPSNSKEREKGNLKQALLIVEELERLYPKKEGWEINTEKLINSPVWKSKEEFASDKFASSIDILAINRAAKIVDILDIKTGNLTNKINKKKVQYQLSAEAYFYLTEYNKNLKKKDQFSLRNLRSISVNKSNKFLPKVDIKNFGFVGEKELNRLFSLKYKLAPAGVAFDMPKHIVNLDVEQTYIKDVEPFTRKIAFELFPISNTPARKQDLLHRKMIPFDLETTGTNRSKFEIQSLSYAIFDMSETEQRALLRDIKEQYYLVSDESYLSQEAQSIHHITNTRVREMIPNARKILSSDIEAFMGIAEGNVLVGHNEINFDLPVLRQEYIRLLFEEGYNGKQVAEKVKKFDSQIASISILDTFEFYKAAPITKSMEEFLGSYNRFSESMWDFYEGLKNSDIFKSYNKRYWHKNFDPSKLHSSTYDMLLTAVIAQEAIFGRHPDAKIRKRAASILKEMFGPHALSLFDISNNGDTFSLFKTSPSFILTEPEFALRAGIKYIRESNFKKGQTIDTIAWEEDFNKNIKYILSNPIRVVEHEGFLFFYDREIIDSIFPNNLSDKELGKLLFDYVRPERNKVDESIISKRLLAKGIYDIISLRSVDTMGDAGDFKELMNELITKIQIGKDDADTRTVNTIRLLEEILTSSGKLTKSHKELAANLFMHDALTATNIEDFDLASSQVLKMYSPRSKQYKSLDERLGSIRTRKFFDSSTRIDELYNALHKAKAPLSLVTKYNSEKFTGDHTSFNNLLKSISQASKLNSIIKESGLELGEKDWEKVINTDKPYSLLDDKEFMERLGQNLVKDRVKAITKLEDSSMFGISKKDKERLNELAKSSHSLEEFSEGIEAVATKAERADTLIRKFAASLGNIPFYNPDQLFSAGYHQIGNVHKSLSGIIPNFLNTSVTKMLMGGMQDYELGWQKWKYGIRSAQPAFSILGSTVGALAGAPFGASVKLGALGGQAMSGLGAWVTQIVGNRYERAINETGLFFSSRFNKMGAMLTPAIAALNLFTKALKLASVPLLAGLGSGLYMYKRALNNMGTLDTPLYNLTGVNYGMGYNQLSRLDYTFGMKRGTTNNIIEGVEFAKQGLLSLGRYDKNKLISSALLGIFNEAYMNPGDGASNYAAMTSKLYENYQNSKNKGRFMYLLNEYNPELAKQLQIRTEYESFLESDRGAPYRNRKYYYNDINRDQRNEFRVITGIQSSFGESIQNSFMKIAAALYNWKGFDFMNRYTSVIGNAADAFAGGNINGGFKIIGDGIIDFIDNLGKTWAEVKEKLGISGLKDTILTYGKIIYHEIKLKLIDLGLFVTDIFGKIKDPAKGFFMFLYEQFKKLFDFVGQIRLNIDFEKLKKGDLGGLQFSVGYKSPGMRDIGEYYAPPESGFYDPKNYMPVDTNLSPDSTSAISRQLYKALGVNIGVYKNSYGKKYVGTTTPKLFSEAQFVLDAMEQNGLPMNEEGLKRFLMNRSNFNRYFNDEEKAVIERVASVLGVAKASSALDNILFPTADELLTYLTGGKDIEDVAKRKLEEAKEKETKLILEFKNDQGKSEQHELIIGQQTGIVEVFGPNWKWGVR